MSNAWTLAVLSEGPLDGAADEEIQAMIDELYATWVPEDGVQIDSLNQWACERLNTTLDTVTPKILEDQTVRCVAELRKLFDEVKNRPSLRLEGVVQDKLARIAKVMREARNAVQSSAMLYKQLDFESSFAIEDAWNPDSFFQFTVEDDKATSFQKLLIAVLKRIAISGLRRLDEDCYEPVLLSNGETTHAWKRCCTIKEYLYKSIQKETDYEEWRYLTNPHDNGEKVVQHLMLSTQMEFPVIQMNRYLWAYRNGLYNVKEDMFFPFAAPIITHFDHVNVETVEAKINKHEINDDDEPINEAGAHTTADGVRVWNINPDGTLMSETFFQIGDDVYLNHCGRESWADLALFMQTYRRGLYLPNKDTVTADRVRELPVVQLANHPDSATATVIDDVNVWNIATDHSFTQETFFGIDGVYHTNKREGVPVWTTPYEEETPYTITPPRSDDVAVKFLDTDFRFRILPEEEANFDPMSIVLPEMEQIMNVQELELDTQKWLLISLARLFFPVKYDQWQVVAFIKGVAGSGKSTLAQIVRDFYPPSCVTTLSSNIEPKFGLSAIYKGLVCVCAEVRADFGLDQGEWQSCISGEEVQINVKCKTAFPHKWTTPFFFLGNELPNYKNASGSVDRRFFLFEFNKKVRNSDPLLLVKLKKNIDLFHRKCVSLYHAALREHGRKDIWAEGVVGEQLKTWRDGVKLQTDLLYAFLSTDRFYFQSDIYMPLDEFKQEYFGFRQSNGMDKVRWAPSHFKSVFDEMGIYIKSEALVYPREAGGNPQVKEYLKGVDLRPDLTTS